MANVNNRSATCAGATALQKRFWRRQVQEDVLAALRAAPEEWFSGKERKPEWPYDLDDHSADHRTRDIDRALEARDEG